MKLLFAVVALLTVIICNSQTLTINCLKDGICSYQLDDLNAPFTDIIISDFGTCYKTRAEVTRYIAGRAAVFFQNIISGNAILRQNTAAVHKIFIDCRNNYNKCDLTNDDAGCTPDKQCQPYSVQCQQP